MVGYGVERYWPAESEFVFVESLVSSMSERPHYVTEPKLLTLDGRIIDVLFTVAFSPEVRRHRLAPLNILLSGCCGRAYGQAIGSGRDWAFISPCRWHEARPLAR
jgi:hypothetical protein